MLVLGLDGATWTILAPLAERGQMPTLRRLMREGAWGVLNSTIPALTPPAWASLITGTNPGKHGIFHFRHQPAGDYYQRRLNTSRDIHSATIWQRLNAHGKRVGIINVPMSHPVQPVDGFITSDAFTPETVGFTVQPPGLKPQFGDYIVDVTNYPQALPGSPQYAQQVLAFIEENERVLVSQANAAVCLMKTQSWQFMMIAWMATDRLGHFCWKYSDPAIEPSLKTDEEKRLAARCRAVFGQIDAQMARLIEAAGDGSAVVIVSDHGFGPAPGAFFNINRWLQQRGYLRLLPPWHWKRALFGYLPRSWKTRLHAPMDSKHGLVDWKRTQAWADPLESRAVGISINRQGRFPEGIVAESHFEALRERIVAELLDLKAPAGGKLFAEIHRGDKLYHGRFADASPDLVAILSKPYDVPPSFRRDARCASLFTPNRHVLRDGGHEPEGIFLLHGANIRAAGQLAPQPIESIVPTVLELFGLPIGDDIDAEPITAALSEEFLRAYPPRRQSQPAASAAAPGQGQAGYSQEDSALVEERLRKLGYLD